MTWAAWFFFCVFTFVLLVTACGSVWRWHIMDMDIYVHTHRMEIHQKYWAGSSQQWGLALSPRFKAWKEGWVILPALYIMPPAPGFRHCLGDCNQSHTCRNRSQTPTHAPSPSGFVPSLFQFWHLQECWWPSLNCVWCSPKLEEHSALCVCLHSIKGCVSAHGTPTGWWLPPADPIPNLGIYTLGRYSDLFLKHQSFLSSHRWFRLPL